VRSLRKKRKKRMNSPKFAGTEFSEVRIAPANRFDLPDSRSLKCHKYSRVV
jgi:hypothetical protein